MEARLVCSILSQENQAVPSDTTKAFTVIKEIKETEQVTRETLDF